MWRLLQLGILFILTTSARAQDEITQNAPACSGVMQQMTSAAAFVGPSNAAFQFTRDKEARLILFFQKPSSAADKLRWRLIERQGESIDYCTIGQGEELSQLSDMHLGNSTGRYGMPGSGLPRCAGRQENGLPGSLEIRIWANKEIGDSLIYDLPNQIRDRDYTAIISTDNTGAWVILDTAQNNPDDTCYYSRGEASSVHENVKDK